jgi:hypothetical protein
LHLTLATWLIFIRQYRKYRSNIESPPKVKGCLTLRAAIDLNVKSVEAVFTAYGWPSDLSDEEILERLLALNLERSAGAKILPE